MRLRRLITKNDCAISDFDNRQHTAMVFVGTIRNGANKLMPTHFLNGGKHYRADLISLEGLPTLKLSAKVASSGDSCEPLYFPAGDLKNWQEFNALDKAEEDAWHAEQASAKAKAAEKANLKLVKDGAA
jgi:hypothetical protein